MLLLTLEEAPLSKDLYGFTKLVLFVALVNPEVRMGEKVTLLDEEERRLLMDEAAVLFKPTAILFMPFDVILLDVEGTLMGFPFGTGLAETVPLPRVVGVFDTLNGLIELFELEDGVRVIGVNVLDEDDNSGLMLILLLSLEIFDFTG